MCPNYMKTLVMYGMYFVVGIIMVVFMCVCEREKGILVCLIGSVYVVWLGLLREKYSFFFIHSSSTNVCCIYAVNVFRYFTHHHHQFKLIYFFYNSIHESFTFPYKKKVSWYIPYRIEKKSFDIWNLFISFVSVIRSLIINIIMCVGPPQYFIH